MGVFCFAVDTSVWHCLLGCLNMWTPQHVGAALLTCQRARCLCAATCTFICFVLSLVLL